MGPSHPYRKELTELQMPILVPGLCSKAPHFLKDTLRVKGQERGAPGGVVGSSEPVSPNYP